MVPSFDDDPTPLEGFRPYLGLLARLRLGRRLRGLLDPSDLVQQTLLRAHRSAETARGADDVQRAAWLRKILDRTVLDEVRRAGRAKRGHGPGRSLLASVDEASSRLESYLVSAEESPSQVVLRHERLMGLAQGLEGLPDDQRRAVELHYLKGRSLAEVAREMDRSKPSVAGLLRRGLRDLRRRISPEAESGVEEAVDDARS